MKIKKGDLTQSLINMIGYVQLDFLTTAIRTLYQQRSDSDLIEMEEKYFWQPSLFTLTQKLWYWSIEYFDW